MIAYLDSSVIIRFLFCQKGFLPDWGQWDHALTSELSRIESLRMIDRSRLEGQLKDHEVAGTVEGLDQILDRMGEVVLDSIVFQRASQAFPTVVRTLDAIHLASAYLWQERHDEKITFFTHDRKQGLAARAIGLASRGFET